MFNRLLLYLALLSLTACTTLPEAYQNERLQAAYNQAIMDAAVIEANEVIPLAPLQGEMATVVTWTSHPDSFKPGRTARLEWGETWVTLDQAVRQRCIDFDRQVLTYRIQQLLGLPPVEEKRYFVTLVAQTASMFRPCANASLASQRCQTDFGELADPAHQNWYARQTAAAYKTGGYPWTRLGYTYDWAEETSEIGVLEYVIKPNSVVKVLSVENTEDYCKKP